MTGIDGDRYDITELPIIISSIFWYLMLSAKVPVVWESVQQWRRRQGRQRVDPDHYVRESCGPRKRAELHLPLSFYFCLGKVSTPLVLTWSVTDMKEELHHDNSKALDKYR